MKLASTKIGQTINEKHLTELQSRLHALDCGKVFIIGFIRFQYGNLSRDCKPHTPIFASLSKHGLDIAQIESLCKGYGKGIGSLQEKEKEKDQEKDQDQEREKEAYHADSRTALHWLNEKSGKHFRETATNLEFISGRLNEQGIDIEGVKKMVARQCLLWKDDPQMERYLRPETLFNKTKFDSYYAAKDHPVYTTNGTTPKPRPDYEGWAGFQ